MKVLWLGGNHRRHLYYINNACKGVEIGGGIVEMREELIPEPPEDLDPIDVRNFVRHFENRAAAERRYFGQQGLPDSEILRINRSELNTPKVVEFVRRIDPDLVLVFGSGMIREPLASALPKTTVNLHLGLSPRYRGAATLFWPFYFLEPNYAGATFHYLVDEPDAGDVIHQVAPQIERTDGIHDVACKTVVGASKHAQILLSILDRHGEWSSRRQRATGKNFLASDFKPQHLRLIYDVYDDRIVRAHLDGELSSCVPTLYTQW